MVTPGRQIAGLALVTAMLVGGKCGGGDGDSGGPLVIESTSPAHCVSLGSAFPGLFDFIPGFAARIVVPEPSTFVEVSAFDVDGFSPTPAPGVPVLRIPFDSDGDGNFLEFPPALDAVLGVGPDLALVTASRFEEVLFYRPTNGQLRFLDVAVPVGHVRGRNSRLPANGTRAPRSALSTFGCVVPPAGAVDSRGDALADPGVLSPLIYCDPGGAPSFDSNFTSGAAIAGGHLFVSTSNLGRDQGTANTQYLPGSVLVFDFDTTGPDPLIGPDPATAVILTTSFNPTHVTSYRAPGGREFVLVTGSGAIGIQQDDPNTPVIESDGIPLTDASIDIIDAVSLERVATVPLGRAGLSYDRLSIDPTGRLAMLGSIAERALLAIDLEPLALLPASVATPMVLDGSSGPNAVIFDARNPFRIPGIAAGAHPDQCSGWLVGTAFNAAGDRLYATDFCDGTLSVVSVDLAGPTPAPVPSSRFALEEIHSVAAPLRADTLGQPRQLGSVRVRPGVPGVDFTGPDVFLTISDPGWLCAVRLESL